jgi:PAS domain S-box-containing protein
MHGDFHPSNVVFDEGTSFSVLRASRGCQEASPDATIISNRAGVILLVNAQTEELFGYGREELIGQGIELLMPARFREIHSQHRGNYYATPRTRPMGKADAELGGLRKDGREFPTQISLSPLETDNGTLVIAAIRNVTSQKRLEENLREESKFKERILGIVGHDLQNPLSAIIFSAESLLLRKELKGNQSNTANRILSGANRMRAIISDLLDFTRSRFAGGLAINYRRVDLREVCSQVLEELRSNASA